MNEMIYGNTGKRDEGINIDMDQALYQKLQSRTFVPKLKSMLNDRLQEGDKSFVFIGGVADKAGDFSVYGYNAKLERDSRGGDYGHYIAVPADAKAVTLDVDSVRFLTEEGFVEYVNLKALNEEKRFSIAPLQIDIATDAKKRIINNLMETFMKVRKRKNVTFSFEESTVEEFMSKSVFVLMDLMKYLPYQMRKNISFISHVASSAKLPDMINLAAYPASSEFKPHDCISLSGGGGAADGIFSAYVEKIFAMDESERESYFEELYNVIEYPAIKAGVDVKSDLYLLDVSTKELWTSGDAKEAIRNIFSSVDDVLKVYPEYKELAKKKMESSENEFVEYISGEVNASTNVEELKASYKSVYALFEVLGFPFDENTIGFFKTRAGEFIEAAPDSDSLIKVLDGIASINAAALDRDIARNAIRRHMSKKSDINGIYELYLRLKEKKFIEPQELNICLTDSVEENILNTTAIFIDSKGKLSALERMYNAFQSGTSSKDHPHVKEVYDRFKSKFSSGANSEAVSKGREILDRIKKDLEEPCSFFDTKNYIKELSNIEVNSDEGLKREASDVYKRVSDKLFEKLNTGRLSYSEFVKLMDEITPAVNALEKNGVYDNVQRSGWGEEKYVPDGMYRFTQIFRSLIDELRQTEDVAEALLAFENSQDHIKYDELNINEMFGKFGEDILIHWFKKHSKSATEHNIKKAKKKLDKYHRIILSPVTESIIGKYLEDRSGRHRGGGKVSVAKLIIVLAAALAILAALGYGGFKLFRALFTPDEPPLNVSSETSPDNGRGYAQEYLDKFKREGFNDAAFVIASVEKSNNSYSVIIKDALDSNIKNDRLENAAYTPNDGSKGFFDIADVKSGQQYAIVIQQSDNNENTYIRDIYPLHGKDATDTITEEDSQMYAEILKYIGWRKDPN